jgi:hypothetical protein
MQNAKFMLCLIIGPIFGEYYAYRRRKKETIQ